MRIPVGFILVSGLLLGGCATQSPYDESDAFFCGGAYHEAAECIAEGRALDGSSSNLLDNMYVGAAHFAEQDHRSAIADFQRVESGIKEQDLKWSASKSFSSDYLARTYDETMVNLYQALSHLQQNRIDSARIEFNRVFERQGRAAQRNAAMIRSCQESIAQSKSSQKNRDALAATKGAKCSGIAELQSELAKWNAYANYMNPAAVFMCGAFRMLWGEDRVDAERGIVYLKRAYGMHPAKVTARAIGMLDRKASGRPVPGDADYVLVLFENGMGPQKVEERKEIVIPYRYPIYAGIALPMLQHRPQAHSNLTIYGGGRNVGATETICEFDRVVAAEFAEELKWISAREYVSACVKVGIQIATVEALRITLDKKVNKGEMSPQARDFALMVAGSSIAAACKAVTQADTRMWSTLPHDYQAAIVPRPPDGRLSIRDSSGGAVLAEVQLPPNGGPAFVYVKIPTAASQAVAFAVNAKL